MSAIKWTKYEAKNRVKCDECVRLLHGSLGVGSIARDARWKLSVPAPSALYTFRESTPNAMIKVGTVTYLCNEHAEELRTEERFPAKGPIAFKEKTS